MINLILLDDRSGLIKFHLMNECKENILCGWWYSSVVELLPTMYKALGPKKEKK
jgi:hypothetical protein